MGRASAVARVACLLLAVAHSFPARRHLAAFVASPSLDEAWKGVGGLAAMVVFLLPLSVLARLLARARAHRRLLAVAAWLLAAAHVVPALDHVPAFAHAPNVGDAWRGFGASIAALWFALPVARQARVFARLRSVVRSGGIEGWCHMSFVRFHELRHSRVVAFATASVVGFAIASAACAVTTPASTSSADPTLPDGNGNPSDTASGPSSGGACVACVQDSDCAGGVCAQFGGDSFCVKACSSGDACASGTACTSVSGTDGTERSACLPENDACGSSVGPSSSSSGSGAAPSDGTCGTLAGPTVSAPCKCSSGKSCTANGCYGGWWCNTATAKCQAPPPSCGTSGGSAGGGAPVIPPGALSGAVGAAGGTISRLYFGVIGDTRPPVINDTSGYPSAVIAKIYSDLEALSPRPPFAVSTGDYLFSSANGTEAAPQLDLYLKARATFSNVVFPAMGNHECTGAVTSNCGSGNADGVTANYSAFLTKMLAPLGQTSPNYVIHVNASDGSWTSKLVFVAGNAWSPGDDTWLDGELSKPTTYTFIIRHEPKAASTAPGCKGSEAIMAAHPYTLAIVGHTHTYGRTGPRQVTIGNGGAPLTGGANYGYGLVQQRADGAIQVDMIDYATGAADTSFRFAVKADGSPAP